MAYTTIDKPTDHFNVVTYTGNASNGRGITGVGHQPDLNIIKSRTTTDKWWWSDSIRGASNEINSEDIQDEQNKTDAHQSFDSDGFTVGTRGAVNGSGVSFCSWNWLAAGSNTTDTSGSIDCTRRSNATAGFAIMQYDANQSSAYTIGHGLNSAPELVIARAKVGANAWGVYYTIRGVNTNWMALDTTASQGTNNADPDAQGRAGGSSTGSFVETSSSLVYINNSSFASEGTGNNIMYAFHSVKGYSKIGEYVGNNSTNGPFIYTGFKPAFVLIKVVDGNTGGWDLYDSARAPDNPASERLQINAVAAEATSDDIDILSNGFKIRNTTGNQNGSGNAHIYFAIAENPFVTSTGVPATAR